MLDADFLEPERLRAFVAVAETASFSRAAERLRLAQPTISIQVRRLEESIGYPLFVRSHQAAALTKEGEAMLGYARELLGVMARARRQFAQPPLEGTVRLGLVEDFNYGAFPEILAGLLRRHTRFELFLTVDSTSNLYEQLRAKALDLVLSKRMPGSSEGEFICQQRIVWVGQPGISIGKDEVVPLVLTPPKSVTRDGVLQALRGAGRSWSIRFEAPHLSGLQAAAAAGLGIMACGLGLIPPGLARVSEAAMLPPLPDVEFALGLSPGGADPVVVAFAGVVRRLVPLLIKASEENEGRT